MSSGFHIFRLIDIVDEIGEDKAKQILSDFYCPLNNDVENFLKKSAITLAKQGVSVTYLVFTSYQGKNVLIGYFTLCNKVLNIKSKSKLSKTLLKKINKFSVYDRETKSYSLTAPLIAQIGKNYNNCYNELISGDELLKIALEKVLSVQMMVGGKVVYLECEDKPKLIDFYSDNGFCEFDIRKLENSEKCYLQSDYLVQMLRYIDEKKGI